MQVNGAGGVQSIASFSSSGNVGFDAFLSSTATGNAATAFACSACGGVMSIQNSQTNLGDVGATGQISLTNGARSVRSTVTAVGNTGSFYVSSPAATERQKGRSLFRDRPRRRSDVRPTATEAYRLREAARGPSPLPNGQQTQAAAKPMLPTCCVQP